MTSQLAPSGAHPTKAFGSRTSASPQLMSGNDSSVFSRVGPEMSDFSSAPHRSTASCSAPSPKRRCKYALLGTPFGVVGLRRELTRGSLQTPSGDLVAGPPSEQYRTTSFRGATSRYAITNLTKLLHLQCPPPASALQSRIRSAARDLPKHRLSVPIVLAMVDFLHDRLQLVQKHESSWAFVRPALLHYLQASDYPNTDDYYNDAPVVTQ